MHKRVARRFTVADKPTVGRCSRTGTREFDHPAFLERLRRGEPTAYRLLIHRLHGALVGVASSIIGSRAQAEEVVQDTWLVVFSTIGRFEGRSCLTTWLFSIVLNRARTRIRREGRTVALPAVLDGGHPGERAVDAAAFGPDGPWGEAPPLWDELNPERIVGSRQRWEQVQNAIEELPSSQRAVIIMHGREGREPREICERLSLSPESQRVLLHRARARIRRKVDAPGDHSAVPTQIVRRQSAHKTTPARVWVFPTRSEAVI